MESRMRTRSAAKAKPIVVTIDDSDSDNDSGSDSDVQFDPNPHSTSRTSVQSRPGNNTIQIDDIVSPSDNIHCNTPATDDQADQPDCSFGDDYEYNLKVMRVSGISQYKTTRKTKLRVALKDLIDELAKSGKELLLTKRTYQPDDEDIPISLDETPQSLDLGSGTILKAIAIALAHQNHQQGPGTVTSSVKNPNIITLKLQDGQRKHLKEYQIGKQESLRILKEKYADEFGINLDRMRLEFDGDPVDDSDTPEALDIEDECVIDVIVSNTRMWIK